MTKEEKIKKIDLIIDFYRSRNMIELVQKFQFIKENNVENINEDDLNDLLWLLKELETCRSELQAS